MAAPSFEQVHKDLQVEVSKLHSAIEALEKSWTGFSQVIDRNPIEKPAFSTMILNQKERWETEMNQLHHESIKSAQETWDHQSDRLKEAYETFLSASSERFTEFEQNSAECIQKQEANFEKLISQHEHWSKTVAELKQHLNTHNNNSQKVTRQWKQQLTDSKELIQSEVIAKIESDLDEWETTLESVNQSWRESSEYLVEIQEHTSEHCHSTSQQLHQEFQERSAQILEAVLKHLELEAIERLENSFRYLVEETAEALLSELAENILKTQFGASVTGSLAPILPQLILLNRATETIKTAIQFFKKMEELVS